MSYLCLTRTITLLYSSCKEIMTNIPIKIASSGISWWHLKKYDIQSLRRSTFNSCQLKILPAQKNVSYSAHGKLSVNIMRRISIKYKSNRNVVGVNKKKLFCTGKTIFLFLQRGWGEFFEYMSRKGYREGKDLVISKHWICYSSVKLFGWPSFGTWICSVF